MKATQVTVLVGCAWLTVVNSLCSDFLLPACGDRNYTQAVTECAGYGGRVCSLDELKQPGKSLPSRCNISKTNVWSSTPCENDGEEAYWVIPAKVGKAEICGKARTLKGLVCCMCGDTDAPTPGIGQDTESPTPATVAPSSQVTEGPTAQSTESPTPATVAPSSQVTEGPTEQNTESPTPATVAPSSQVTEGPTEQNTESPTPTTHSPSPTPTTPVAKNILLLIVDDLKPAIKGFGDPIAVTPNFDRVAARGVRFTKAYTQIAICGPSRTSFLTSRRPDATNIHTHDKEARQENDVLTTVFQAFRDEGFHVFGAGKVFDNRNFPYQDRNHSFEPHEFTFMQNETHCFDQPADVCMVDVGCKCMRYNQFEFQTANDKSPSLEVGQGTDDIYIDGRITDAVVDELTSIKARGIGLPNESSQPFLVTVGFRKPHLPFNAPQAYWDLYNISDIEAASFRTNSKDGVSYALHGNGELNAYSGFKLNNRDNNRQHIHGYLACVSFIDAQIGTIMDSMDELGYTDNTAVIVTSDHGFHLGDHGLWCKHSNFEHATRVPLIVAPPMFSSTLLDSEWDTARLAGTTVNSPVELLDLGPTMLDLVGLWENRPVLTQSMGNADLFRRDCHGKSLRGLLLGNAAPHKSLSMSQYPRSNGVMGYGMRTDRYRFVWWVKKKGLSITNILGKELYDYNVDPGETENVANEPSYAAVVEQFREYWDQYVVELENNFAVDSDRPFIEEAPFDIGEGVEVMEVPDMTGQLSVPTASPVPTGSVTVSPTGSMTVAPTGSMTVAPTGSVTVTPTSYTTTTPTVTMSPTPTPTNNPITTPTKSPSDASIPSVPKSSPTTEPTPASSEATSQHNTHLTTLFMVALVIPYTLYHT